MRYMIPLMHLFRATGQIDGRTKVQKMVYILQCMGFPFPEHYRYHLHGPYSQSLTRELAHLVELELLTESVGDLGEAKRFSYQATDDLAHLLDELSDSIPSAGVRINFAQVVNELNEKPSPVLEATATALFLNRIGTRRIDLFEELLRRKPHLNKWLDPALKYLDSLSERGLLEVI